MNTIVVISNIFAVIIAMLLNSIEVMALDYEEEIIYIKNGEDVRLYSLSGKSDRSIYKFDASNTDRSVDQLLRLSGNSYLVGYSDLKNYSILDLATGTEKGIGLSGYPLFVLSNNGRSVLFYTDSYPESINVLKYVYLDSMEKVNVLELPEKVNGFLSVSQSSSNGAYLSLGGNSQLYHYGLQEGFKKLPLENCNPRLSLGRKDYLMCIEKVGGNKFLTDFTNSGDIEYLPSDVGSGIVGYLNRNDVILFKKDNRSLFSRRIDLWGYSVKDKKSYRIDKNIDLLSSAIIVPEKP